MERVPGLRRPIRRLTPVGRRWRTVAPTRPTTTGTSPYRHTIAPRLWPSMLTPAPGPVAVSDDGVLRQHR